MLLGRWVSHAPPSACCWRSREIQYTSYAAVMHIMRTNIEIDDELMNETLRRTGLKTKREAVDVALRTLLRLRQQEELRRFRGQLDWNGDLDAMRRDR